MYLAALVLLATLAACAASVAPSARWSGQFIDPDGLSIIVTVGKPAWHDGARSSKLTAHSAEWSIQGSVGEDDQAHLAGLDGVLSSGPDGIVWSNDVAWREDKWSGEWMCAHPCAHSSKNNEALELLLLQTGASEVRASSSEWKQAGEIGADHASLSMWGMEGRRSVSAAGEVQIEWDNGDRWLQKAGTSSSIRMAVLHPEALEAAAAPADPLGQLAKDAFAPAPSPPPGLKCSSDKPHDAPDAICESWCGGAALDNPARQSHVFVNHCVRATTASSHIYPLLPTRTDLNRTE
mgnify:CR=1 FL=1|jgi:hypothetical protein